MTKDKEKKIIKWLLSDDTGASSKSIATFMTGNKPNGWGFSPPSDKYDRGRCSRLLDLIPEWWNRLSEMKALSREWSEQIDILLLEHKL